MQPIERYGVIALVFFLVTIAAVVIWGPGSDEASAGERGDGALAAQGGAPARTYTKQDLGARNGAAAPQRGFRPSVPLNEGASRTSGRTPAAAGGLHSPGASAPAPAQPSASGVHDGSAAGERVIPKDWPSYPPQSATLAQELEARQAERAESLRRAETAPDPRRASPPASPRASNGGPREYVVKPGDTLSEIALAELGTSKRWKEIQALNGGLDPAKLAAGMKLKLPAAGPAAGASAKTAAATPPAARPEAQARPSAQPAQDSASTYVVANGDSLWKIAERRLGDGLRWKEIEALNPGLPSVLLVGTKLKLPADAAPARAASSELVAASAPSSGSGRVR